MPNIFNDPFGPFRQAKGCAARPEGQGVAEMDAKVLEHRRMVELRNIMAMPPGPVQWDIPNHQFVNGVNRMPAETLDVDAMYRTMRDFAASGVTVKLNVAGFTLFEQMVRKLHGIGRTHSIQNLADGMSGGYCVNDQLRQWGYEMRQLGFTMAGKGMYGLVLKRDDRVYKLVMNTHDNWKLFAKWVRRDCGISTRPVLSSWKRHLPVIYEYVEMADTGWTIAEMEVLTKARTVYDCDLADADHDRWRDAIDRVLNYDLDAMLCRLNSQDVNERDLIRLGIELYNARASHKIVGAADLHAGNVMLRGQTLVITDPLC